MHYTSGIFDGDMFCAYDCLTCKAIINHYSNEDRSIFEDGIPEGFVNECLNRDQTPEQYLELLTKPTLTT